MKDRNRHMRSLSCLILTACLLLGLLAGCGKTDDANAASTAAESTESMESAESAESAGSAENTETAESAESAETHENADPSEAAETAEAEDPTAAADATAGQGTAAEPTPSQDPGLAYPYELDEGRLVVNSVFQSSVSNPDCNNEVGEDIVTLELLNQSGLYLDSAVFTVTMTDGQTFQFEADAIPDGGTVWAFELSNGMQSGTIAVESITCTAYYLDEAPMLGGAVTVETDGVTATVSSQTDEDLSGLQLGFHCVFEGIYYGGLTIDYSLESLPARGTEALEITECWLGEAACVFVRSGE